MSWSFYTRNGVAKIGDVSMVAGTGGDADTLDGLDSTAFWKKTDAVDSATLNTHPSTDFYLKTDSVDADTLDGLDSTDYWKKTDTLDADTLSGFSSSDFVLLAGDTMTGPLLLSADPTTGSGASTKNYTDTQDALQVLKTGDTMTGNLTVPDPIAPGHVVNLSYLGANYLSLAGGTVTGNISSPDPTSASHLSTKNYNDSTYVALSGATMTGQLTLSADPTNIKHSATKQYVDRAVGSSYLPVTGPITADHTIIASEVTLYVDPPTATSLPSNLLNIDLPATHTAGEKHLIKSSNNNAVTNNVQVNGNGSNIDDVTFVLLPLSRSFIEVVSDGTNWIVVNYASSFGS